MAVADQQVTDHCHEQRLEKEGQVGGGGGVEPLVAAAAKLQTTFREKEMVDKTLWPGGIDAPVGEEIGEEENELHKEWRERERSSLEYVEKVTSNPRGEQERLLEHILKKNANTVYLQQFQLNGATDVQTFRQRVPVSDYDTIRPLVERICEGDKAQLLSADPVVELLASSGTSGGGSKLFPITEEDKSVRALVWNLMRPALNKSLPGLDEGKCMFFYFVLPGSRTKGGVLRQAAVTSFVTSEAFKQRSFDPSYRLTTPDEAILARNYEESMYCHLICGLLQREEVLRLGALFAPTLVRCIRMLDDWWPEICEDLVRGTLSETKVPSDFVRAAMKPYLRADPELAAVVRQECSKKSWDGIIRRLWPNVKVLDTVCTGAMEVYMPILHRYSDDLPVICSQLYASSEGYFGLNLNPMCPPEQIYYTLLPTAAYYEFIPASAHEPEEDGDRILDLTSLQEGQEYEILVTTVSGLCRFRVGDVLKLVGFYNDTPTFKFMRRSKTVLCVDTEKTDEKELQEGVSGAAKLLEDDMGLRLQDFSSSVDFSTAPGHYVIYLELRNDESKIIPTELLEQCCVSVESSFNAVYKRNRANNLIASIELRILKEGTFERLADFAFAQGASPTQYKTPRGFGPKSTAQLQILNDGVIQKYTCQSCPTMPDIYANVTWETTAVR